jgi:catechol 2,3-dioxygenase-like lactoylglutathione lyase family enzyme
MARTAPYRFLYTGIRVRNLGRSIAFYRGLGFRIRFQGQMEHGGKFVHMNLGNYPHRLELNYYPPSNRFYEPYKRGSEFDHLGFYAKDMNAVALRAKRMKAPIAAEWVEGGSRLIYLKDPDGLWVEFFGPAKPPRKRSKGRKS